MAPNAVPAQCVLPSQCVEPFVVLLSAGTCSRHPGAKAGWRCEVCDAARCPGCVYAGSEGERSLALCSVCGGLARRIHLARAPEPLATRLFNAFALPLHPTNLAAFGGLVVLLTLLAAFRGGGIAARLFGAPQWLLGFLEMAFFWATFFGVARAVHAGENRLPIPAVGDLWHELLLPGMRGELLAFPLLFLGTLGRHKSITTLTGEREVPFVFLFTPFWSPLETTYFHGFFERLAAASPWVFAAWAIYLAWLPLTLATTSEGGGLLEAVNPASVVARLAAVGPGLVPMAIEVVTLGAVALAGHLALDEPLHRLPLLGPLLLTAIALWPLLAMAALVGDFLAVHGARLGFGTEADHTSPALPGVSPRGRREPRQPAP